MKYPIEKVLELQLGEINEMKVPRHCLRTESVYQKTWLEYTNVYVTFSFKYFTYINDLLSIALATATTNPNTFGI